MLRSDDECTDGVWRSELSCEPEGDEEEGTGLEVGEECVVTAETTFAEADDGVEEICPAF